MQPRQKIVYLEQSGVFHENVGEPQRSTASINQSLHPPQITAAPIEVKPAQMGVQTQMERLRMENAFLQAQLNYQDGFINWLLNNSINDELERRHVADMQVLKQLLERFVWLLLNNAAIQGVALNHLQREFNSLSCIQEETVRRLRELANLIHDKKNEITVLTNQLNQTLFTRQGVEGTFTPQPAREPCPHSSNNSEVSNSPPDLNVPLCSLRKNN